MRVLAIAGSLRENSYNRGLVRAAAELAPQGMSVESFDLRELPLYDADVEAAGLPEPVARLKEAIRSCDGLLIATPEYNYGVPGVLKNAVDWASRPPAESPLRFKPVAIAGASAGRFGTRLAQSSLRQNLTFTRSLVLPDPELLIPNAGSVFDARGDLHDAGTRERLAALLAALAEWAERVSGGSGLQ
jgi:chromate reductase